MSIFYFKSNKGIIDWSNKREIFDFLLNNDGKGMYADLRRFTGKRSGDQNAWYWVILEQISKDTGNSVDDLHRLFKGLFLPKKTVKLCGKEYVMSGSTTELNKTQFGEYIEKIRAHVAPFGIVIPDPIKDDTKVAYPTEELKPKF
jgi:hypothetical protein